MQFHQIPERLLSSQTSVRVLRVLLRYPQREMSGRQVAELSGAPLPRVIERLRKFEEEGLVSVRAAGPSHLWRLEAGHVMVRPLSGLFEAEAEAKAELRDVLRRQLNALGGIQEARLFGSMARGDEIPLSDVDLFILVKDRASKVAAARAVEALRPQVRARFGNALSAIILTAGELKRRPRRAFLVPAREEGELLAPAAALARRRRGAA